MTDLQRELIGSVTQGKTKGGKIVAHLFSIDKRLEYPALVLFDLSMLEQVGIDPNTLDAQPIYRRFWAHYTENLEKLTSKGNPYKDVAYLTPIENGNGTTAPPPMNDAMLAAILAELQKQTALLKTLVGTVAGPIEEPEIQVPLPDAEPEPESELEEWFAEHSDNTPTSPRELLKLLADNGYQFPSARVLHDALAAQFDETWRGWPPAGDTAAWSHIATTALQLAEA